MGGAFPAPGGGGSSLGGGPGGQGVGGGCGQCLRPLPAGAGGPGPGDFPDRGPLRVRVARAFTSHQLVRLLKEELAGELEPLSLVLVLGPVSLFYDEQIPLAERRRLFTNMVDILSTCKIRAPLLLLQPPRPRGAANRRFGELLTPMLDYLVRLTNEGDGGKINQHRGQVANLPFPGT